MGVTQFGHLCDWSNCDETKVFVSINYRGEERPTFCCAEHAALWQRWRDRYAKPPVEALAQVKP